MAFVPGLSQILEQERRLAPGSIIGEAVERGFEGFVRGAEFTKKRKEQERKANLDYINTYMQLRQKGFTQDRAEEEARKISGFRKPTPIFAGFEKRLTEQRRLTKEEQEREARATEALITARRAKALPTAKKINPQTQKMLDFLLGTEKTLPQFKTREEAEEFIETEAQRQQARGVDVELLREKVKALPTRAELPKGFFGRVAERLGFGEEEEFTTEQRRIIEANKRAYPNRTEEEIITALRPEVEYNA